VQVEIGACAHFQVLQEAELLGKQHEQRAALSMAPSCCPAREKLAVYKLQ
jgi:hypothetical protein